MTSSFSFTVCTANDVRQVILITNYGDDDHDSKNDHTSNNSND